MTTAPVLDRRALSQLGDELGDNDALRLFVNRYATMLDQRVDRLERALDAHDVPAWEDAALSLKVSSEMAGATALSKMVGEAQCWLKPRSADAGWPCHSAVGCLVMALRLLAAETARQLRDFVEPKRSAGT